MDNVYIFGTHSEMIEWYESEIKPTNKEGKMKNNTQSQIVIQMRHIDHAERLKAAIQVFANLAGTGGDAEMFIRKGPGNPYTLCRFIGHDVDIKGVQHLVPKGE